MCVSFILIKKWLVAFSIFLCMQHVTLCAPSVEPFTHELNVAVILKNPNTQPHFSQRYLNYYKQGLDIASYYAEQFNIKISYNFYEMSDVLHLPALIKKIEKKNPDFIIGPNYSNEFLLLKDYFKDTLVLSANASDRKIREMPKNFYTLTPLSDKYGQAIANYLFQSYKKSNVFTLVDVECKACVDLASEVQKSYIKNCQHKKIYVENIVSADIESDFVIPSILENYKQGDVILMLAQSYTSMVMIIRLVDYFKQPITFIGADNWGSDKDSQIGDLPTIKPYTAIHVIPWSLNMNTHQLLLFKKLYSERMKNRAPDNITYATFSTVYSVIDSLRGCKYEKNLSLKETVLQCFLTHIANDKQPINDKYFAIERLDKFYNKDVYIGKVSSSPLSRCSYA